MPIDPYRLFAFYHLGFDDQYRYRFRNLHHAAAHFAVDAATISELLTSHRMQPADIQPLDFNLAKAHGDAMELDLFGATTEAREEFARATWARLQAALADGPSEHPTEDIDWDDPLCVGKPDSAKT